MYIPLCQNNCHLKLISKKWTNIQETWLIHGTKHQQGNQLQSLELSKHMYYSTYLHEYIMRRIKEFTV